MNKYLTEEDTFYMFCADIVEAIESAFEFRTGSKACNYVRYADYDFDIKTITFYIVNDVTVVIKPDLNISLKANIKRCKKAIIETYREEVNDEFMRDADYEW